jgi:hypothetical protein
VSVTRNSVHDELKGRELDPGSGLLPRVYTEIFPTFLRVNPPQIRPAVFTHNVLWIGIKHKVRDPTNKERRDKITNDLSLLLVR